MNNISHIVNMLPFSAKIYAIIKYTAAMQIRVNINIANVEKMSDGSVEVVFMYL